ncbi:MAG: DNA helicase PcrA [Bacillota bacterium]
MDFLTELNPAQAEAVCHPGGALLVLAGAGSGKTRVLTSRIAYLVRVHRVEPHRILAITFTNRAAREMKERVARLVPHAVDDLWVMTFHAACLRILRREIEKLGYGKNFVIYDEADQQTVIKDCLKELNLELRQHPPAMFSAAISWQKNALVGPAEFAGAAYDRHQELTARVYAAYQARLERNNALDFDDLLFLAVRLFREFPPVLEQYRRRFLHLLVDEYQDTNHAQYVLVNLLAQTHRNLTVVGDPDQCIYGWRGADLRNILNFERDYPDARVVKLEQNYRSTGRILEAANHVIRFNRHRKEKELWTARGAGEAPVLHQARDERAEARFVAREIRRLRTQGRSYRDFAVFYRTHAQSRVLEDELLRHGVPYTIIGGVKFYDRKEIKDLLAYLKLIVNPDDDVALTRIINVPRRGVGKASLVKFFAYVRESPVACADALREADRIRGLSAGVREAMGALGEQLARWREWEGGVTGLTEQVLEESGYLTALEAERTVEARTRMENLSEFLSVTREFDLQRGGPLAEFLNDLALYTDLDRFDGESSQVTLMTLHSAKGLEFPVVFLTGMEEGVFPHTRAFSEPVEMEEERRLCYVGITRARERLFLTLAESRLLYGNVYYGVPSRFLREIPPELFAGGEPEAGAAAGEAEERPEAEGAEFRPGDRVRHGKWGEGMVVQTDGTGLDAQVKVAFPDQGVKTLMVRYAPLELLRGRE